MKNKQTHLPYAIIAAIIIIIIGVIFHLLGYTTAKWPQYVQLLPFLICILLNAQAYSKANDHWVTFGNVFSSGFKLTLIVSIIMAVWGVISVMIFPEIKDQAMDIAEQSMIERGVSEEQIEMSLQMTSKYFSLFGFFGLLLIHLFWGTIFSLIGGAIAKKKGERPPHMELQ